MTISNIVENPKDYTHKKIPWLPSGWGVGEGIIGSLGLVDANYYMDKQQGPTV